MKNKFKLLGIVALCAVIGFFAMGCDEGDQFIMNWTSGTLPSSGSQQWYTFSVTSGTTYYIWVKEYWSNSVSAYDNYADVRLDARYGSQTGTVIFTYSDAGANNSPASFTANQSGTVHLRVYHDSVFTMMGTMFRVAVTTSNSRPAGE
ncbi:MAG: hypothetical protein FWD26_07125 [Treponema sp.]|nr:hypothetical protein [Treponema sp.]